MGQYDHKVCAIKAVELTKTQFARSAQGIQDMPLDEPLPAEQHRSITYIAVVLYRIYTAESSTTKPAILQIASSSINATPSSKVDRLTAGRITRGTNTPRRTAQQWALTIGRVNLEAN